jgi:hypothetical protein
MLTHDHRDLYQVIDDDGPLYVLATSFGEAVDAWKAGVVNRLRQDAPGQEWSEDGLEPNQVMRLADRDELLFLDEAATPAAAPSEGGER